MPSGVEVREVCPRRPRVSQRQSSSDVAVRRQARCYSSSVPLIPLFSFVVSVVRRTIIQVAVNLSITWLSKSIDVRRADVLCKTGSSGSGFHRRSMKASRFSSSFSRPRKIAAALPSSLTTGRDSSGFSAPKTMWSSIRRRALRAGQRERLRQKVFKHFVHGPYRRIGTGVASDHDDGEEGFK
jgi:hypothetical protein